MIILKTILISSYFLTYRRVPKVSPRAYIFQRPFLRGLFLEGLIFGGAYVRREICVSKSIGLACSGKEIYHFCFVLLCIREQIPCTSPLVGLYLERRFNGGFFALRFWGAYVWRGLFSEFYGNSVQQTQVLLGARKYVPFALLNYLSYFSTNNDSMTFQARKMKFYKFHYMTLPSP